jgi:hypothetical protein
MSFGDRVCMWLYFIVICIWLSSINSQLEKLVEVLGK